MRLFLRSAIFIIAFHFADTASSQTMQYDWSRSYTIGNLAGDAHIATDSKNGIYTVGPFSGSIQVGSYNFTGAGSNDILLTKHDSTGHLIWAKAFGGSGTDIAKDISIDRNGNVVIVGYFDNSISFGINTLTSLGTKDGFVVKIDAAGTILWAKQIGGNADDDVVVVECYKDDIYIGGGYASTNLIIDGIALTVTHPFHGYYAKLDPGGNAYWAKKGSTNVTMTGGGFFFCDIKAKDDYTVDLFGYFTQDIIFNYPFPGLATAFPNTFRLQANAADGSFISHSFGGTGTRTLHVGRVAFNSRKTMVYTGGTTSLGPNYIRRAYLSRRDSSLLASTPTTSLTGDVIGQASGSSYANTNDISYVKDTSIVATGNYANPTSFGNGFQSPSVPTANTGFLWGTDTNIVTRRILTAGVNYNTSSFFSSMALDTLKNVVYIAGYFGGTGNQFIIGKDTFPTINGQVSRLISKVYLNAAPPAPLVVTTSNDTVVCAGGTASIRGSAAGGVPGYSYAWSPTTGVADPLAASTTASPATNTTYTLTITDAALNRSVSTIQVNVTAAPAAPTISGSPGFCTGGSTTLTSSAADSYLWSTGATTQSITINSPGSYSLVVKNAAGCSSPQTSFIVTETAPPAQPGITASGPLAFCAGGSVTLTSTPASAYNWSNGASTQSITVNTGGNYSVITSSGPGCNSVASAPVTVTVWTAPSQPVVSAAGPVQFCEGGSVQLSATAATTYLWSTGATTQNINVNTSGNYTVTVTNAQGCSSAAATPVAVTVWPGPAQPTITASGPLQFCPGGSVTLTAPGGGTWLWSNGATTQSITVTTAGNYSVVMSNAQGCNSIPSAAITVTVNSAAAQPTISASGPLSFCEGGSVTLTSSAGNTYTWSNGAGTPSITVATAGNYSVIVTNAQGCSSVPSANSTITVNALPPVPFITRNGNILNSSAATGNQWYLDGLAIPGATSNTLSITGFGNYTVMVTNAAGCSRMSDIFLVDNFTGRSITLRNGEPFYYSIRPNPAVSQARMDFILASPSSVSISMLNEKGNQVAVPLALRQLATGSHTVQLDAYVKQLPAGIYLLVYRIDDEKVIDKILIIK